MWDPALYLKYADERGRPFADLIDRVRPDAPRRVVDLGCGPGNLTATLAQRWPDADVTGVDSSPEMIARAQQLDTGVAFEVGDVRAWRPQDADVVVSNAALQWIPEHPALLSRWMGELRPGAWLAFQVPGNGAAPAHQAIRTVATEGPWRDDLTDVIRHTTDVRPLKEYGELLLDTAGKGAVVDCWETTYLHVLPVVGDEHPVLDWLAGTGLRPVRAALGDSDWAAFRAALTPLLVDAYPESAGVVLFPFRRIFAVAHKA